MTYLPLVADRVLGRPLLITPDKAQVIFEVLQGRITPNVLGDPQQIEAELRSPIAYRDAGFTNRMGQREPTYANRGGVAHIPIIGSLVNRGAWIGASSGLVSYEGIRTQIMDAVSDTGVKSILLDINSPGGEAGGMFALANTIREAAGQKPVVAFVNDMAASAAYGIASQASQIVVSPSSVVGSIGVVLMHLDRSAELAAKGVKATLIHAGAHKVDGNPFGPLPEGVRADLQAEVDKIYGLFIQTVAEGRGRRLSAKAARATEARVFMGQDAIDRGLADGMASFDEVIASLQRGRKISFNASSPGVKTKMSIEDETKALATAVADAVEAKMTAKAAEAAEAAGAVLTPAGAAAAAAASEAAPAASAAAGDATADAKARIKAITKSAEAEGRTALAEHLAFETDLSAEAAKAILAAAPKADAEKALAAQAYIEQKASQGALGVSPVAAASAEPAHKAGWSKAVAAANRKFDLPN